MKNKIARNARPIGIALLGLYLLLSGAGIALQFASGAQVAIAAVLGSAEVRLLPAIALTSWAAMGSLLVARRPDHPIGWLFCANALLFAMDEFAVGYAYIGYHGPLGSLPFVEAATIWLYWSGTALTMITGTLLFLLYPTGRPLSPRWYYLAWVCGGALAVYVLSALIAPMHAYAVSLGLPTDLVPAEASLRALAQPILWASLSLAMVCGLVSMGSLIVRLGRSTGVERQQIKWFVYTGSLAIPTLLLLFIGVVPTFVAPPWVLRLSAVTLTVFVIGVAVSAALAILRYRLWDIDVLIRRTLIYGSLSVLLALLYYGMVTLLQDLVSTATGQRSQSVIVISTLAIAALFNPLRGRIQDVIDRRFYRRKYDAAEILARFGATAQERVELEPLTAELLEVVERTLEPESVSLMLRES